ncbi:MAG: hypothetical protein FD180_3145 [Planctomycetota bacterium]|nr:MAG: hypothetical protein FD180_3145 [Planctomycetota bacterium]
MSEQFGPQDSLNRSLLQHNLSRTAENSGGEGPLVFAQEEHDPQEQYEERKRQREELERMLEEHRKSTAEEKKRKRSGGAWDPPDEPPPANPPDVIRGDDDHITVFDAGDRYIYFHEKPWMATNGKWYPPGPWAGIPCLTWLEEHKKTQGLTDDDKEIQDYTAMFSAAKSAANSLLNSKPKPGYKPSELEMLGLKCIKAELYEGMKSELNLNSGKETDKYKDLKGKKDKASSYSAGVYD